jgi:cell wall-associated protease
MRFILNFILIFLFGVMIELFYTSCSTVENKKTSSQKSDFENSILDKKMFFWQSKDNRLDSKPGISIDKWYNQNKKQTKLNSIIVAVIDTQLDVNHEELQGQIWNNTNEVPDNKIDDDQNGYIDDVNGWNFIGTKSGNYIVWGNFEFVRFIREWKSFFDNKTKDQIAEKDMPNYKTYNWAIEMLKYKKEYYRYWLKSIKHDISVFPIVKDTLKHFFPKEDYSYKQLDSLYKKIKTNDRTYQEMRDSNAQDLPALIYYMMVGVEVNEKTLDDLNNREVQIDSILNKNLNIDYNERLYIGDNYKVLEKGYGNNKINAKIKGIRSFNDHNTKVSSIIAANRLNNKGTNGFSDNIKIMPLTISPSGDEHDKDITMAIRYAVDNGAKVINMSFGKEFSLHREWVLEAIKYAEKNNVLLVHSAGNDGNNVDTYPSFPTDCENDGKKEGANNFINVGSISSKLDSTFVSNFSNYGKQNVDLFAPGEEIYTAIPDNKYEFDSGTSLSAPMVSGTAALIWLYYPKLSVNEVKQIILDSGIAYDIEVIVPGTKDKKVHFSELSKSGKALNVYNAMKLAEEVSKKKK